MDSFRKLIEREQPSSQHASPEPETGISLADLFGHFPTVHEIEERVIREAMELAKGNQGIAASLLGMTRQTLNNRLKITARIETRGES